MKKRTKFMGPFQNSVSFDKKEIRQKIIVPTFNQARRCSSIYDALIQEFYENGCLTSAKYFKYFMNKERILYESSSIRYRICDEPNLLLGLFDNCKVAETADRLGQCNGPAICSHLLLQCILLFEEYDTKYNWIFMDIFTIITKICEAVCQGENNSKESLCQIYYKFGVYLTKTEGIENNRTIYIKAYLNMAEFYIESSNYKASLSILDNIFNYVKTRVLDMEYFKFLSRYHHLRGICFERLELFNLALDQLNKSLQLARQLNMKHNEGIILIDMAKVYMNRGRSQFRMAESCFKQSKEIFVALHDIFNIRKVSYLIGSLEVHNIQPMIFDLIKFSSNFYCDKYRLIYWTSMCFPFWLNLRQNLEREKRDSLQCILQHAEFKKERQKKAYIKRRVPKN